MNTRTAIGGAGVFDAMIVAGIIAVALAEIVGETRERLSGGPGVPSQGEKEGDD